MFMSERSQEEEKIWAEYYKHALALPHSKLTKAAVELNESGLNAATDCGCGTGADIEFLLENGYQVHGFDKQHESIAICQQRFNNNDEVQLATATFEGYAYKKAGVLLALSSLYFADSGVFSKTWSAMTSSIAKGGVFAGTFLGYDDDWVKAIPERVCPVSDADLSTMFEGFEVIKMEELKEQGNTLVGNQKFWHKYAVLAIKRSL